MLQPQDEIFQSVIRPWQCGTVDGVLECTTPLPSRKCRREHWGPCMKSLNRPFRTSTCKRTVNANALNLKLYIQQFLERRLGPLCCCGGPGLSSTVAVCKGLEMAGTATTCTHHNARLPTTETECPWQPAGHSSPCGTLFPRSRKILQLLGLLVQADE